MQTITFQKLYDFYKNLYVNLRSIKKLDRYTWGEKCDKLALDSLSLVAKAGYLPKTQKWPILRELSFNVDLLKIYLRLGRELEILEQTKYLWREKELVEIGKLTGGWLKSIH